MRGVRTVGLCSPRPRRVGYHEAKAHEKHRNRELTDVGTRCDTPALDLHCAPRLWHNRALEKTLSLAHGAADFSSLFISRTGQNSSIGYFGKRLQTDSAHKIKHRILVTRSPAWQYLGEFRDVRELVFRSAAAAFCREQPLEPTSERRKLLQLPGFIEEARIRGFGIVGVWLDFEDREVSIPRRGEISCPVGPSGSQAAINHDVTVWA